MAYALDRDSRCWGPEWKWRVGIPHNFYAVVQDGGGGAVGLEEVSLDASSISVISSSGSGSAAATGGSRSGGGTGTWLNRVAKKLLGVAIVSRERLVQVLMLFPCLRRLERVESMINPNKSTELRIMWFLRFYSLSISGRAGS